MSLPFLQARLKPCSPLSYTEEPISTILTPFGASSSNVCLGWSSPVGRLCLAPLLLFPGMVGSLSLKSIHDDHQQDSARHGGEALGALRVDLCLAPSHRQGEKRTVLGSPGPGPRGLSLMSHLLGLRPGENGPKQVEDPGQTK